MTTPYSDKKPSYFPVDWPAPEHISAYQTTRNGGDSRSPFDCFNLALHVNDSSKDVMTNRHKLVAQLKLSSNPIWLEQVHGTEVVNLDADHFASDGVDFQHSEYCDQKSIDIPVADASYCSKVNRVCTIMTADCLPILLCSKTGDWVAAVHAGWRGLAKGIIEQTILSYSGKPSDIIAWLGPAISQKHFEVGEDVRQAFIGLDRGLSDAFSVTGKSKYHADLYFIANELLSSHGIKSYGGDCCTFSDNERFYSYRRDGKTGRMASLIWINKELR